MFIHEMRRAVIDKGFVDSFDDLLDQLPGGFNRALLPARQRFLEILRMPPESVLLSSDQESARRQVILKAEFIVTDDHIFIVEMLHLAARLRRVRIPESGETDLLHVPGEYVLDIDCYGPDLMSQDMQTLIDFLNEKFSVTLEPHFYPAERFEELKEEGRTPPSMPDEKEITASDILADRSARTLAIAVRQGGGLLRDDLQRQLPEKERSRTDEIRIALEECGVLTSEAVVICKKSGSQVVIVPAAGAVSALAESGFKCPCGTPIDEEKVDTAFSISDIGRQLLDGSHWFTILLIVHLVSFGIRLEDILVDQVSGGDEMDCIAAIEGSVVLFELKAKEFNLGNAYSFGAKIGIIEPDYPVIVTTHHVGADAREHFSKSRRRQRHRPASARTSIEPDVIYIEGLNNLQSNLMSLIARISFEKFSTILSQLDFAATLPMSAVEQTVRDRYFASGSSPAAISSRPT